MSAMIVDGYALAQIMLFFTKRDGSRKVAMISGVRTANLAGALGLHNGDLILAIDGFEPESLESLASRMALARDNGRATVLLRPVGIPRVHHYACY